MTNEVQEFEVVDDAAAEDAEPVPPIQSRFLLVDVAAQRAKQLRRGARPRIPVPHEGPMKYERLAMTEVTSGLVPYTLPPLKPATGEGGA